MSLTCNNVTVRASTLSCVIGCMIMIALDIAVFNSALFDPLTRDADGAYHQYLHIRTLIEYGWLWQAALENPIILNHVFRYLIYWPFMYLNELGVKLEYVVLVIVSYPVVSYYYKKAWYVFLLLPLVAAYFISFRAVLTAIGVGYIVIYLFGNGRYIYLLIGMLLSFLSSAVQIQILLLIVMYSLFRDRRLIFRPQVLMPILFFVVIVVMGVFEKIDGFSEGGAGYAAMSGHANDGVIAAILSRGTLYLDMLRGSIRGYAYTLAGLAMLYLILWSFLSRNSSRNDHRFILLSLSPGFLVEGLGVNAIMMVFLWALFNINLHLSRTRPSRVISILPTVQCSRIRSVSRC